MKRLAIAVFVIATASAAAGWSLTASAPLQAAALPVDHLPDLENGERLFHAGGCASCHVTPEAGEEGADTQASADRTLGGGLELDTPFGLFRVPNISPDEKTGIGVWSALDFSNAMLRGVSPSGEHYYPAFPYGSYARMTKADVLDLHAFLMTLPAVESVVGEHELDFPYSLRRGVGVWKRLYLKTDPIASIAEPNARIERGRYLVEGAGHCGECHTSRTALGGLETESWLAGAPNPDGDGTIPNITPHEEGIGGWSAGDIAYYLESGFTPEFDVVGGSMVAVQEEMARLPAEDREAIAAYLKAVDPKPDAVVRAVKSQPSAAGS